MYTMVYIMKNGSATGGKLFTERIAPGHGRKTKREK